MDPAPALHPDLAEIAFLLGTWRGLGEGEWPRGEPFAYGEEMTFEHVGDDYLLYAQWSWMLEDGSPSHCERGFLRRAGPGRVELVLAHPLGVAEVAEGTVAGSVIELASRAVVSTTTGSRVSELRRWMEVSDATLAYELHMAMPEIALTRHLTGTLTRAS